MGEMWGADLAQLRTLAKEFDAAAQSLEGSVSEITATLAGVEWLGPSGDQFREEWDSHHAPSLRQAANDLAGAKSAITRNADQQEQTSDELTGGGSTGGSGGGAGGVGGIAGIGTMSGDGGPAEGIGTMSGDGGAGSPDDQGGFSQGTDDTLDSVAKGLDAAGLGQDLFNFIAKAGTGVDALTDLGAGGHLMEGFGKFFAGASVITGGLTAYDEWSEGDFYGGADGAISAGLGVAVLATAATPAGPFVAAGAAVWAGASLLNGVISDRPLSENLMNYSPVGLAWGAFSDQPFSEAATDAGGWVWDRGSDAVGGIADAAGDAFDAGGDFIEGAGDVIGGLFD